MKHMWIILNYIQLYLCYTNKIEIAIAIKWLPEATEISCVFGQEYNFDLNG